MLLSVSPVQLHPALTKDVAALFLHVLGWNIPPTGRHGPPALVLILQLQLQRSPEAALPRRWVEATQLIGQTRVLNIFLTPGTCQRQHSPADLRRELRKLGSAYDHSVSLDLFPFPSVQMNNESDLSFPFCKP